jgi:hypothetical protein
MDVSHSTFVRACHEDALLLLGQSRLLKQAGPVRHPLVGKSFKL